MTECINCSYLVKYPTNEMNCLMKQNLCIVEEKTLYPKNCGYFKGGKKNEKI